MTVQSEMLSEAYDINSTDYSLDDSDLDSLKNENFEFFNWPPFYKDFDINVFIVPILTHDYQ